MKKHLIIVPLLSVGAAMLSGCVVEPNGRVGLEMPVIEVAPQPVYVAPPPVYVAPEPAVVLVPDNYVWDGYEYVGFVNGQYFYLGGGNVWLVCDPFRLDRFNGWARIHPDWRNHAVRNDRFRTDSHGHVQPRRNQPARRNNDHH